MGDSRPLFLPWTVDIMNGMRKPFFSTIFTYSSSSYTIPVGFEDITKVGPDPLCKSISYADYGFRDFWLKARKRNGLITHCLYFVLIMSDQHREVTEEA